MTKLKTSIPLLIFLSLSIACVDQKQYDGSEENNEASAELKEEAKEPQIEQLMKAYYPIPSPDQMTSFINDNGLAYDKGNLSSTEKAKSYVTPKAKALNLGVYTADLAYAASFEDIESTLDYYKVVRMLGSQLEIEEMMGSKMASKLESNLQNKDSLKAIAGRSYFHAVEYLEANSMQDKLALMSLGGWLESLYIAINSVKSLEEDQETVQRIADQKVTFGNLYTYLKKNDGSPAVKEVLGEVQGIRSVYGSLIEKKVAQSSQKEGEKMVLGSSKKITITQEQFDQLKTAINDYRNKITS